MRSHILGVSILIVVWFAGLAWSQITGTSVPVSEIGQVAIIMGGIVIAIRFEAPVAQFPLAGGFIFLLARVVAHAVWGMPSVQGRAMNATLLAASLAGVCLGAMLSSQRLRALVGGAPGAS